MTQAANTSAAFERTVTLPSSSLKENKLAERADPWQKMRAKQFEPSAKQDGEDKAQPLAVDVLAEACPLSKAAIKRVMQNGAVWLRRKNKKVRRLRRAKTSLRPGDEISIFYDPKVQAQQVEAPTLIADEGRYTVWDKPAGMLSQGSKYGDHCAITRWVEKHGEKSRQVYLVHRLDRAASGLILLAHDRQLAAALSALFQSRDIEKTYKVSVHGAFNHDLPYRIDASLDGKPAISVVTKAEVVSAPKGDTSALTVQIETGRKHQIRRHLADFGFPVVGDHLHGREADRNTPMQLRAVQLAFTSPVSEQRVEYTL